MTALREHLDALVRSGRKLLVPYVVAGVPDRESFADVLAAISGPADAVELGLPFSDPLMDGPVIAEAAQRALRLGVRPVDALQAAGGVGDGTPAIAMTYYNPIHRTGEAEFCARAAAAGISGLIVPDLPLEESASLRAAAAAEALAWIPLVAPTSPPDRVKAITATSTGFVYAVSTLGVTGTREQLSERAARVVEACREATDAPVLVGIGVSTPAHAVEATGAADGVVIGTAVVRLVLEEGAASAGAFLAEVRAALDAGP